MTNTGQHLRINPDSGAVGTNPDTGAPTIDGDVAYAADDGGAGKNTYLAGAGYTNSVPIAGETQLSEIDVAGGVLALQNPPNDGVLNTVGALGIELDGGLGFDITPGGAAYLAAS